ncbi:MAG TPA: hypothetical protein EYP32_06325 [Aquificaceae bacterium]|nr:hypothetical protein [Aquificaceae bacterium]
MEFLKEIIKEGRRKFLGYIEGETLKFLEELLKTDLGVQTKERRRRPFVAWYDFNTLKVVFLTQTNKKKHVNLKLCEKYNPECNWIKENSYVFQDRKRGYAGYSFKEPVFDYVYCGECKDLDFLEELNFYTF